MIVDPRIHDTADPVPAGIGDYICSIAAIFTDGDCGAAESVISVSKIRTKAKN